MFRYILALALLIQALHGFSPNAQMKHSRAASSTFRPANFVSAAAPTRAVTHLAILRMAAEGQDESTSVENKIGADGTFYDDEVDSAPIKDGISDSMKARLMAEASTGLDSNSKQTNVILYIILGVAVLVVLGGAGVFY